LVALVASVTCAFAQKKTYILYANADTKRDTLWVVGSTGQVQRSFRLDKSAPTGGSSVGIGTFFDPNFPADSLIGIAWVSPINKWLVVNEYKQNGELVGSQVLKTDVPTWHVVGIEDFDGNGTPDVIAWDPGHNEYHAFDNNGERLLDLDGIDEGFFFLPVASDDVNGDGHPDIVLTEQSTNKVKTLYFNGDTAVSLSTVLNPHDSHRLVVGAADVNDDGFIDIFSRQDYVPGTDLNGQYDTRISFFNGGSAPSQITRIQGDRYRIFLGMGHA